MENDEVLNLIYKEFGDNICLFPFLSMLLVTWSNTNKVYSLSPCTVGSQKFFENDLTSETDASAIDTYNRQEFLDFRDTHFKGKGLEHPYCAVCKNHELNNAISSRKANNYHFANLFGKEIIDALNRIKDNGNKVSLNDLFTLDYMPSSYCNFACIMCFPQASTSRREHMRKMGVNQPTKLIENNNPHDLDDIIMNAHLINFTGGETMLQPQVIKCIDMLIEKDRAKEIKITFLTNLSKYDKLLMTKLEKFRDVVLIFSIDGTDEIIEYQRIGAKWKDVSQNILAITQNHSKIGYVVNYVVTAVSVFGLPRMIKWCKENNIASGKPVDNQRFLNISPVFKNPELTLNAVPTALIDSVVGELTALKNEAQVNKSWDLFSIMIDDSLNYLKSHKHDATLTKKLKLKLEKEDLTRNDGLTYKIIFGDKLDEY